jgi:hypothetical protein
MFSVWITFLQNVHHNCFVCLGSYCVWVAVACMHTHAINGQHLAKHVSLPQWIQELQGVVNAGHDGDEESSQESDSKKA